MHAVSLSDAALARYLLGAVDDGVFVDTTNKQGLSALHLACRSGHSEIVARLLAAGANRHAVGHKGTSALIEAIKANSIDCVCHLLEGDDPSE
ncbi:ankyrin repeat-containing domain protein, partial [Gaertneriomyces semiglobifer]